MWFVLTVVKATVTTMGSSAFFPNIVLSVIYKVGRPGHCFYQLHRKKYENVTLSYTHTPMWALQTQAWKLNQAPTASYRSQALTYITVPGLE